MRSFPKFIKKVLLYSFFFIYWLTGQAQPTPNGSGDLLHSLKKFQTVGTALYVAAHPDDENTLLITWLANEKKVRTGYIAMTRGDGGQNLIGSEKNEFAGLLRTNELLDARSIDGGEQYFTRANDFGYTKTTEEALKTWGEQQILSDLVFRIRKFQPDVIITRFPPDERAGHGHHSASSLLAERAFEDAAKPNKFPEQLTEVSVWQAKRLVWNFYNRGFTNTPPEDDNDFIQVDIGGYNPLLGASYGELGSKARSMHKSQGFGAGLFRGERLEVLKHTKGTPAENDLFDGVNTTWSRIPGGQAVDLYLNEIIQNFNPEMPSSSVPSLLQLRKLLESLPASPMLKYKKEELTELILKFSGLYVEINTEDYAYAPTDSLKGSVSLTNRINYPIALKSIAFNEIDWQMDKEKVLTQNERISIPFALKIPDDFSITQPYWLQEKHPLGSYVISDENLKGMPLSPPALTARLNFIFDGTEVMTELPATYKYVEPAEGEIYRPLEIRPAITLTPNVNSLVFNTMETQEVLVTVKANMAQMNSKVELQVPVGWTSSPENITVFLNDKYDEKVVKFLITPSKTASKGIIKAIAQTDHVTYDRALNSISYKHVPQITSFPLAEIEALKLDLKIKGKNVAYVMGAGDEIPLALSQMGYKVTVLSEADFNNPLSKYDAILIGGRAYNTNEWLTFQYEKLMSYVENGGNLICQYQTRGRSDDWADKFSPYSINIGRDRVSQEDAEVRFIDPSNPIVNWPNKLDTSDFEGWVQERGLYFASEWDQKYTPILSMNDTGEEAKLGSLLHTKYGKGNFVYTGLSFFRELPAGVPGAYRLLANLISLK